MGIKYCISEDGIKRLNQFFTHNYNYKYWYLKLKTNDILLENAEAFIEKFGDAEFKEEAIEPYKLMLKSEIVISFYHMAEALFSLMITCKYSKVPWLSMKDIRFERICNYVRDEIISGKISDEDIRFLFYNGVIEENAKKKEIVESIAFIKEFLKRIGKLFLENDVYTEYKHGLRMMPFNSYIKITGEADNKNVLARQGTSHVYLSTKLIKKEGKEEQRLIEHKTVSFDYKLYLRLCIKIFQLMNNLFSTRQQGEKLKEGELLDVGVFNQEKIEETFKEEPINSFTFTIKYN